MKFDFMTAGRIIFEAGAIEKLGAMAAPLGKKAILVTGMPEEATKRAIACLESAGVEVVCHPVFGEPSIESLGVALKLARDERCDFVIGFGGGSSMDTGKALAAMLPNPGDVLDYLEVIGKGKKLVNPSMPCIAVPTTAGTGAEVTKNAVLYSKEHRVKVSLRSPTMLPTLVLLDPALTVSVPPAVTASTGLDALTQVIEPFVSCFANPITDVFCREGMMRAARSLLTAYRDGSNLAAREDMTIASLCGGLALANAKLGIVHGFASVIGGLLNAPHGAVCASLLAASIQTNVEALTERGQDEEIAARFDEVARILTGDAGAKAQDGVVWIQKLCKDLNIPGLAELGLKREDFDQVAAQTEKASSTKGNPIKLTTDETIRILERSI